MESIKARVDELMDGYARALDRKDLEKWAGFFARQASYYVIPRENLERNLPMAHVFDDTRERIDDRVDYIRKVWHRHYNDYQTRHILSSTGITAGDAGEFLAATNVAIYMTDFQKTINWGPNGPWLAAPIQLLNSIGALTMVYAFRHGKVIIVSPMINALAPVITILLSLALYRVIPHRVVVAGMALAALAFYLMS